VFYFLRDRRDDQSIKSGLAMNIDEYVPTITPTIRTKEKSLITLPPKKNSAKTTISVVSDVSTVRESV